jgi:osmotically inducible protein OsmC
LQATITQIEKELTMTEVHKVLYTAKTHTTGGRDGASRSSDGRLDIKLSSPGTAGTGTNPEQLFAAGWSACFEGAMELAVRKMKTALPADLAIDAEVDLILADGAYFLGARLNVSLPGLEREAAQALVDEAHRTCPYSKLTRGNIDVAINLVLDGHTNLPAGVYQAAQRDRMAAH